jgi:peptidoglycan/LPS O-acetylase OafA/YrhL
MSNPRLSPGTCALLFAGIVIVAVGLVSPSTQLEPVGYLIIMGLGFILIILSLALGELRR